MPTSQLLVVGRTRERDAVRQVDLLGNIVGSAFFNAAGEELGLVTNEFIVQ